MHLNPNCAFITLLAIMAVAVSATDPPTPNRNSAQSDNEYIPFLNSVGNELLWPHLKEWFLRTRLGLGSDPDQIAAQLRAVVRRCREDPQRLNELGANVNYLVAVELFRRLVLVSVQHDTVAKSVLGMARHVRIFLRMLTGCAAALPFFYADYDKAYKDVDVKDLPLYRPLGSLLKTLTSEGVLPVEIDLSRLPPALVEFVAEAAAGTSRKDPFRAHLPAPFNQLPRDRTVIRELSKQIGTDFAADIGRDPAGILATLLSCGIAVPLKSLPWNEYSAQQLRVSLPYVTGVMPALWNDLTDLLDDNRRGLILICLQSDQFRSCRPQVYHTLVLNTLIWYGENRLLADMLAQRLFPHGPWVYDSEYGDLGSTPALHWAVKHCSVAAVQILLAYPNVFPVDALDTNGVTALESVQAIEEYDPTRQQHLEMIHQMLLRATGWQ